MQWILFLLLLMGQCSFFTCQLYEYHFIDKKKTWKEAQTYYRKHYTDLATVFDMTDMERLGDLVDQYVPWIGLYDEPGGDRGWRWSLPGVEYNENKTWWKNGEPNGAPTTENCALMHINKWFDEPCNNNRSFICYNESAQSSEKFHLIEPGMTWPKAQNYCREHHTDLISGYDQLKNLSVKIPEDSRSWIGLFRDSWRWSDGSRSSFRKWESLEASNYQERNKTCAMVNKQTGKLLSQNCDEKKSFVCYRGQCSSSTCQDHEYVFIGEKKTWKEAQTYCKENYTDLATVFNMTDMERLVDSVDQGEAWIGLYNEPGGDRKWHWSLPGVDYNENESKWRSGEPNDGVENCVAMNKEAKWSDFPCNRTKSFICFDDKVILIKENKTWDEALNYCREHHRDLASITDRHQQRWARERAKKASTPFVWLGLRYTCTLDLWFWVSDEAVSYKNWASSTTHDDCDMSGAIERGGEHKWVKKNDANKFNFICSKC